MEKAIFTEQNMYTLIGIWYKHDEIFQHIARGLVQTKVANGETMYGDFIWELQGLADKGWCRNRVEA